MEYFDSPFKDEEKAREALHVWNEYKLALMNSVAVIVPGTFLFFISMASIFLFVYSVFKTRRVHVPMLVMALIGLAFIVYLVKNMSDMMKSRSMIAEMDPELVEKFKDLEDHLFDASAKTEEAVIDFEQQNSPPGKRKWRLNPKQANLVWKGILYRERALVSNSVGMYLVTCDDVRLKKIDEPPEEETGRIKVNFLFPFFTFPGRISPESLEKIELWKDHYGCSGIEEADDGEEEE